MTIDHRKVVALATHETPFVKRVDDIDDYQVTTTVTRYTKSVWLTDKFKTAALDLNFAYNKSLTDSVSGNNLVTFSRASGGTYVGADGLIKTATVNLLRHSENLSVWFRGSNSSVTANQAVAPDGTTTADRVQHPAVGSSWISQIGSVPGVTYTVSVYAKAVTPGTNDQFTFQLGFTSPIFTATDEWQRFTFTGTATGGSVYINNSSDSFATDVYFWGAQLEEGPVATEYIPTATTSAGAPRFDHDFATRESLGLLMEKATTNLLLKSEKLNEWIVGNGSSVTADQAVAPDGTTTADRVQHGSGGSSWIRQDVLTSGVTYTVSVYAKAVTPGTNDQFTFDLGGLSSIFVATGEWQRFTFTGTASNASIYLNNGDDSFATDVYFWGAQVEEGSFATSYIATDSSSVTRAADFAEITGTNFSNFFNQNEGTILLENAQTATPFVPFAYDFSDGTTDNSHRLLYISTSNPVPIKVRTKVSNINVTDISFTAPPIGQFQKAAYGYKADDFALSVNGASVLSDTNGSVPTVINKLNIGNAFSGTNGFIGHIKRLAYFPTRLGDNTLQAITS